MQKDALEDAASQQGQEIIDKERNSQLQIHSQTLDIMDTFVDRNTDYRIAINDITHSITQTRQAEMKEAKKAK